MRTRAEALDTLARLGAPAHLLRHVGLVGEALEELLVGLRRMSVALDAELTRIGVVLHDTGKILHPEELVGPGGAHEPAGEALLLDHGVEPRFARVCRSHARWREMDVSFEELVIALADKLWKGKRDDELEARFVDELALRLRTDRWQVFIGADTLFEAVASKGPERLARSVEVHRR